MPIPEPKSTEKRKEYMKRCISFLRDEGKEIPQAIAICSKEWSKEFDESFTNYPKTAVNNAKRVLKWREEHGDEVKGGTRVGWTRANQIANKEPLSRETVGRIAAFARHEKNSKIADEYKATPWKDRGYVAWLLWGGTPMINWAKRQIDE